MTIKDTYFNWMYNLVCRDRYNEASVSYRKLFRYLHATEFRYSIPMDENRAEDGISLRYKFAQSLGYEGNFDPERYLENPCSVLEMMIALAVRCEVFMDDTSVGDRTSQWFWVMITNLGIGSMTDDRFDVNHVRNAVERFLDRDYEPDGRGGLFRVRNCNRDLRDVEIWKQLSWYLGELT